HVDTRNQFHIDHVFPATLLDKRTLRREKDGDGAPRFTPEQIDDLIDRRDRLPNLQLLPGLENIGKSAKTPEGWLAEEYSEPENHSAFIARNALPQSLPNSVTEFMSFYDKRSEILTERIHDLLTSHVPEPSTADTTALVDLDEELAEGDDSD